MHLGLDVNTVFSQGHRGIGHSTGYLVGAIMDRLEEEGRPDRATLYFRDENGAAAAAAAWAGRPGVSLRPLGAGGTLAGAVRADGPDLLHLNDYFYPLYEPGNLRERRFAPARVVITVNDLIPLLFPRQNPAGAQAMRSNLLPALPAIHHVIAVSAQTRRDLSEHLGVDPARVTVIPLGVDRGRFHPRHPAGAITRARERYGLERPFVLYVAGLDWRKNHPLLVEGFARFWRGAGRGWDLVLAGHGTGLLRPLAEETPWEGNVKILEYVVEEDIPLLYAAAGIFAFPSRYEGFGLPILEAMASGVPVVAAGTSSVPEVAGNAALLADPDDPAAWADALTRLAQDGGLRRELRARGMKRAAAFSWKAAARRHLELYRKLLAED